MNSIKLKTNELLIFYSGCHGNRVFIATSYQAAQRTSMSNMDSIQIKTKELLTYHYGCHGNLVTIATKYVADVYCPIEPPYQISLQYDLRQRS